MRRRRLPCRVGSWAVQNVDNFKFIESRYREEEQKLGRLQINFWRELRRWFCSFQEAPRDGGRETGVVLGKKSCFKGPEENGYGGTENGPRGRNAVRALLLLRRLLLYRPFGAGAGRARARARTCLFLAGFYTGRTIFAATDMLSTATSSVPRFILKYPSSPQESPHLR